MLERVWRKGNPLALLVGMQTSTATMENSLEIPYKTGNRTALLLLLSHFSRVQLCVTPQMAAHQAPPSLGFSRQEHWSGLPFPLLGIHTEETRIERDTCTPMFITALFIIAKTWKQPRCPLADEWIRKLWYIYTMEYYSAIKKNTFESVLMRWMKLEPIYTE